MASIEKMNKDFQDRVDELLMMEERSERRQEEFMEMVKKTDAGRKNTATALIEKLQSIENAANRIARSENKIDEHAAYFEKLSRSAVVTFMGSILISILIVVCTWLIGR